LILKIFVETLLYDLDYCILELLVEVVIDLLVLNNVL